MTTEADYRWISLTGSIEQTEAWAAEHGIPMSQVTHPTRPQLVEGLRMNGYAVHRSADFYDRADAAQIESAMNDNLVKSGIEPLHPFFGD